MKRKPIVGETLYQLVRGRNHNDAGLRPVKVISVGRKYFKCCPSDKDYQWITAEFHIDTWRQRTDFNADYYLYESEQERLNELELNEINSYLRNYFSGYGTPKATLEQLRAIKTILSSNS